MYDVVIIGSGPAGLFAAYKLIEENKNLKILMLEKGSNVANRMCPMNKLKVPCKNCNPCGVLSGYGGAGTFSDGKLNFIPRLGKSDLTKSIPETSNSSPLFAINSLIATSLIPFVLSISLLLP